MCLRTHKLHYTIVSVALYVVKSVYAGHAALHSIGTGLILTLLHSLPVYSHMIRLSACLFWLTAVYSLTFRLAACLVLHYQPIRLIFSHYQAYCMSTLTRRLAAYLFCHSHSGSLPIYSHTIRLAAYLFSHYQTRCLSILTLSGLLPTYSH